MKADGISRESSAECEALVHGIHNAQERGKSNEDSLFWIEILNALKINILVKRFSSNITYSEFSKIRLAGVSYS